MLDNQDKLNRNYRDMLKTLIAYHYYENVKVSLLYFVGPCLILSYMPRVNPLYFTARHTKSRNSHIYSIVAVYKKNNYIFTLKL